jgi:hypothetical protein
MAEEDAELALRLMRPYPDDVLEYLGGMLRHFPNITKELHGFCAHVDDRDALTSIVLEHLEAPLYPSEYQLFWLGKIAEAYLLGSPRVDKVLMGLLESDGATPISKAKVLEIPEARFGMPELREEQLKTGQSDWLAWSAAVGTRTATKATRNWVLKYFSKGSPMNYLIGSCIDGMEDESVAAKASSSKGKAGPGSGKGKKARTKPKAHDSSGNA